MDYDIELEIDEVCIEDTLFPKSNVLIIKEEEDKDASFIKEVMKIYKQGSIVCCSKKNYIDIYSEFLEIERCYSRFSTHSKKRMLYDNTFLVIHQKYISEKVFADVINSTKNKNMINIFIPGNVPYADTDFIIIKKDVSVEKIKALYTIYFSELEDFSLDDFKNIINNTDDFDHDEYLFIILGENIEFKYIKIKK